MNKIKKFFIWLIILDWVKINLWKIYTMLRRANTRHEDWNVGLLRKIAPSWRDDVTFNTYKEEKEVNE